MVLQRLVELATTLRSTTGVTSGSPVTCSKRTNVALRSYFQLPHPVDRCVGLGPWQVCKTLAIFCSILARTSFIAISRTGLSGEHCFRAMIEGVTLCHTSGLRQKSYRRFDAGPSILASPLQSNRRAHRTLHGSPPTRAPHRLTTKLTLANTKTQGVAS